MPANVMCTAPHALSNVAAMTGWVYFASLEDHLLLSQMFKKSIVLQARQLLDIVCVELLQQHAPFVLTYTCLSVIYGQRHFLRYRCSEAGTASLQNIFKSACWLEREIWDMFGVFFSGAIDLRRILTDYGFHGHPLRRAFP